MKIEDILNLTEGQLTNNPQVQAIESATVYYSKVEHGDLFFSSNHRIIFIMNYVLYINTEK